MANTFNCSRMAEVLTYSLSRSRFKNYRSYYGKKQTHFIMTKAHYDNTMSRYNKNNSF